jgi:hypothetical protein
MADPGREVRFAWTTMRRVVEPCRSRKRSQGQVDTVEASGALPYTDVTGLCQARRTDLVVAAGDQEDI